MKKIALVIKDRSGSGEHDVTLWPLGIDIGLRIDGSNVLKGHGLDHSNIRTHAEAVYIAQQIVDAVNAQGGIEMPELETEYRLGKCPSQSWNCACGRFDKFKKKE